MFHYARDAGLCSAILSNVNMVSDPPLSTNVSTVMDGRGEPTVTSTTAVVPHICTNGAMSLSGIRSHQYLSLIHI